MKSGRCFLAWINSSRLPLLSTLLHSFLLNLAQRQHENVPAYSYQSPNQTRTGEDSKVIGSHTHESQGKDSFMQVGF